MNPIDAQGLAARRSTPFVAKEALTSLHPVVDRRDHHEPSIFAPESLLREARRQRGLADGGVPDVCLLDPDGDVVRSLQSAGNGRRCESWSCYHTDLWETEVGDRTIGVVGNAVGAPFAVLVAEELFACECRLLVSVTSAGQLDPTLLLPCTILVQRALRGEGTSYAYLPPDRYVDGEAHLLSAVAAELQRSGIAAIEGGTWTTDAPFRETRSAIEAATADRVARGRDGSRRPLRLRPGQRAAGDLLRARHQPDGTGRR